MNEPTGDRFVEAVRRSFGEPPDPPREEMWTEIEAALERPGRPRNEAVVPLRPVRRPEPWWGWGAGWVAAAAAVVAVGSAFVIGRATAPPETVRVEFAPTAASGAGTGAVLVSDGPSGRVTPRGATSFAAARLLASSGTLLREVESTAPGGRVSDEAGPWARSLLTQTRLLLDSPVGADAELGPLLEDLELVLVQVVAAARAQTSDDRDVGAFELERLRTGLRSGTLLPRIRRITPPTTATEE